jgi:hypothetical protein
MTIDTPANSNLNPQRKPLSGVLLWVVLVPFILAALVICGQLALLVNIGGPAADTRSRLSASYSAWGYDLIPPINIPALLEDIRNDARRMGLAPEPEDVVPGVFVQPPTPAVEGTAVLPGNATPTLPATETPQATVTPPSTATRPPTTTATPSASPSPTNTWAPLWTATPTVTETSIPTRIPTSRPTATSTNRPPPPPTATSTNRPPPPPTATSTNKPPPPPTATDPVKPTQPKQTATTAPTATQAQPTKIVKTPDPHTMVRPVVDSVSESGSMENGCQAIFGYINDHTQTITIPIGDQNYLSIDDDNLIVTPGRVTSFAPGGASGVMTVHWNAGSSLEWKLGGFTASAKWCR